MATTDAYDLLGLWLGAARDALALTSAGVPLDAAGERAFVSAGPPAFDCCPFVSVHAGFLGEAPATPDPGGLGGSQTVIRRGVLQLAVVVTAVRCVPMLGDDGALPTTAALEQSALETSEDLWAIWNHVSDELRAGALGDRCKGAWREAATPITPSGGCGGWVLTWRVPIDGAHLGGS